MSSYVRYLCSDGIKEWTGNRELIVFVPAAHNTDGTGKLWQTDHLILDTGRAPSSWLMLCKNAMQVYSHFFLKFHISNHNHRHDCVVMKRACQQHSFGSSPTECHLVQMFTIVLIQPKPNETICYQFIQVCIVKQALQRQVCFDQMLFLLPSLTCFQAM